VVEPWQANVDIVGSSGHKLGVAVGRQVHRGKRLVIQRVRERQSHVHDAVVAMDTDICRAWHDAATYLGYLVLAGTGRRGWRGRGRRTSGRCWRRCAASYASDEPEHLVRPVQAEAGLQTCPIGAAKAVAVSGVSPGRGVGVACYTAALPIPVGAGYGSNGRNPVSS
jgi:hypothetical protein